MRTGSSSAHGCVKAVIPERPASRADHVDATSPPTGVVAPRPVTTTSLLQVLVGPAEVVVMMWDSSLPYKGCRSGVLLDVADCVADRPEVFHVVVGDLDAELLLRGDHDLDHGQRVHVEVVDEGLVELYVRRGDAGDLVDDLCETGEDLLLGVCHYLLLLDQSGSSACGYAVVGSVSYGRGMTCAAYARPATRP